jgi:hypothetical protein
MPSGANSFDSLLFLGDPSADAFSRLKSPDGEFANQFYAGGQRTAA